jgi:hypothetical protein
MGINIEELLDDAFPEINDTSMWRGRPYEGQSHTDHGERGKTEINGITFRDLRDCFVRAACLSSGPGPLYEEALKGEKAALCENDIYTLGWDDIDPIAVAQNLSCEIERLMRIFPNVPKLHPIKG